MAADVGEIRLAPARIRDSGVREGILCVVVVNVLESKKVFDFSES